MPNPWLSRLQERQEAITDRLLNEQAEADAAFRAIVGGALTAIKRLEFPLGCPTPGYDIEDVIGALADWLTPISAQAMASLAADAANDARAEAA